MSSQTKSPNKWVLLLLRAALVTGAFVIPFDNPESAARVRKEIVSQAIRLRRLSPL